MYGGALVGACSLAGLLRVWNAGREAERGLNMPTSDKKTAANRINGRKSRGPKNTASTRWNATKHGLLAAGVTELDDAEGYRKILLDLAKELSPVGTIEMYLVESAALDMVRCRRARRWEAEYITEVLNPPIQSELCALPSLVQVLDPGLPAVMKPDSVQRLVSVYQRYESTYAHQLFRSVHELERQQRTRQGERLPVPATLDVSVHHDTGMQLSTMPSVQEQTVGDSEDTAMESSAVPQPQGGVSDDREDKD